MQRKYTFYIALAGAVAGTVNGLFGAGGGMMMLIVFTAMLGYERKTAVGTSTFIMTFTALIASVSHILIEPTIIYECWDFLLLAVQPAGRYQSFLPRNGSVIPLPSSFHRGRK